ncbi:phosphotransferase [Streptomyces sp. LZ34]
MAPEAVTRDRLAAVARAALGGGRRLEAVERVAGGSTKGVYRLTMDDATTAIAYLWDEAENYWPSAEGDDDLTEPFSPGVGLDLVMDRLAEALEAMRRHRAPAYGKVAVVDSGGTSRGTSCEGVVLKRALRDLAEAASRDPRVAGARDRLEERLRKLAARVRPRAEYAVVHGELGPGHVQVDADGRPVVIDIEGLMYFDVEWEHVHLRIRLHDAYRPLAVGGLDEGRLALYMLAQRLSLTAGPLRLLDGDFPNRTFMAGIAEYNLKQALALVGV